jgi:nitrogen fixation/metabolism regulation signal transduction histidine kinase
LQLKRQNRNKNWIKVRKIGCLLHPIFRNNSFIKQTDIITSPDDNIKRDIRLNATEKNSKIIIYIEDINKKYLVSEIAYCENIEKEIKGLTTKIFSISLSLTFIMLILCAVFAFLISNSISTPLRKITEMAKNISKGHLNINKLSFEKNDELKQLNDSFNLMADNYAVHGFPYVGAYKLGYGRNKFGG